MFSSVSSPNEVDGVRSLLGAARAAVRSFHPVVPITVLEEVVQESVARWMARPGVRNPPAFVRRVARNLAVDHLRRARREVALEGQWTTEPWVRVDASIDLGRAVQWLASAPEMHRRTLLTLVIDDQPVVRSNGKRGQDALYKRRARAIAWMRTRRGSAGE